MHDDKTRYAQHTKEAYGKAVALPKDANLVRRLEWVTHSASAVVMEYERILRRGYSVYWHRGIREDSYVSQDTAVKALIGIAKSHKPIVEPPALELRKALNLDGVVEIVMDDMIIAPNLREILKTARWVSRNVK